MVKQFSNVCQPLVDVVVNTEGFWVLLAPVEAHRQAGSQAGMRDRDESNKALHHCEDQTTEPTITEEGQRQTKERERHHGVGWRGGEEREGGRA